MKSGLKKLFEKKIYLILVSFFILIAVYSLYPRTNWKDCLNSTSYSKKLLKVWTTNELQVKFAPTASKFCPGPGFPQIFVSHNQADNWLHIVKTDIDYNSQAYPDPSWNLGSSKNPWVFLDVSSESRSQKKPFYMLINKYRFHDNPNWGSFLNIGKPVKWIGHIYPVKILGDNIIILGGISWGFTKKHRSISSFVPSSLNTNQVEDDIKLLEALFRKWKLKYKVSISP